MDSTRDDVTIRIGTLGDSDALSREYWASIPPVERLAQVWDLVCEYAAWRTPDAGELRLQRSVLRLQRR